MYKRQGLTRGGRFAAVTNFREPQQIPGRHSRGQLCLDFLAARDTPSQFLSALRPHAASYSGFNLLLWNGDQLMHFCNREMFARALGPGIYGISNGTINDSWPKVTNGRRALAQSLAQYPRVPQLLDLLDERSQPSDAELPDTGVGLVMERLLAPRFIHSAVYGTRSSSVVYYQRDGSVRLVERQFSADGTIGGQVGFEFTGTFNSVTETMPGASAAL